MQRYESYKPSGVKWLGDIPSHWNLKKSKFLWWEKEERSLLGDEQLLSVSQYSGIVPRAEDSRSESLEDYKRCEPDDLVINIMLAWMSGLGISKHSGIVSPAYCVYRQLENHNPYYFDYLYRTPQYLAEFARRSKGIVPSRWRMYTEDFGQVLSLLPPRNEQDRIVVFLDHKTAEIDAAIAKKERVIDLLQEQRFIQVNRAVTLGLDRTVSLRSGESEWIELLPAHWEVVPLKRISTVQSGITLGKSYASSKATKSFPYLRVANVQDGYIDLSTVTEIVLPVREAKNYLLRIGDILVTEGGDIDKLGRGNCWDGQIEECLHQNHVFAVRILKRVRPEFVALITGVAYARRYFTTTANKTTNLASTNKAKLGNLPVLVPPLQEQDAILRFCNEIKAQYDALISSVSREISVLKEMKSSLVADVVTGRIKI